MVEVDSAEAALAYLKDQGGEVAMMFADVRLPWPTIRVVLTSGGPDAASDDLPDGVTFMPKPWRGLDLLVEAERAVRQPEPLVT